jgi:hypothetical protein
MTYTLHQYKTTDFVTFRKMIWAVFYHHFGIHDMATELGEPRGVEKTLLPMQGEKCYALPTAVQYLGGLLH